MPYGQVFNRYCSCSCIVRSGKANSVESNVAKHRIGEDEAELLHSPTRIMMCIKPNQAHVQSKLHVRALLNGARSAHMHDGRIGNKINVPAYRTQPVTKVYFLEIHKVGFVKAADG